MRIVVTGGSGFIGKPTMGRLAQWGHEVWPFDLSNGDDILGDLTTMDIKYPDVIINLAGVLGTAELFDDPSQAVDINVQGALNILQWCRRNHAGYVGITMPPVFPSVYTATKICADRLATAWHLAHGVSVSRVCAYNAYGPGQRFGPGHPQKIIPTFAVKGWRNEPIPVWGDGSQTVDLVHVDDVAHVLAAATRFGGDQLFDAGTGVSVSVKEVADAVIQMTGSTAGIEYLPMRKGEVPTQIVAKGEGWDLLGWRPEFSWERIEETVRWYAGYDKYSRDLPIT